MMRTAMQSVVEAIDDCLARHCKFLNRIKALGSIHCVGARLAEGVGLTGWLKARRPPESIARCNDRR